MTDYIAFNTVTGATAILIARGERGQYVVEMRNGAIVEWPMAQTSVKDARTGESVVVEGRRVGPMNFSTFTR